MRRVIALALVVLGGAGCVTVARWERPGATEAEVRRDETECAARADRTRTVVGRRVVSSARGDVVEALELVPVREFDTAAYDACMEARGYRRVEVQP